MSETISNSTGHATPVNNLIPLQTLSTQEQDYEWFNLPHWIKLDLSSSTNDNWN